ncbi:MAG TPA: SPASM domain-containing protein [Planctomycetota bacterium]|nr:SPASM domain-containing protein [Planctomycetota bacterium]
MKWNGVDVSPEMLARYKDENEARVRDAARAGREVIDGLPLKLTLELTADCNLYCRHCEFPEPREQGREKNYRMETPLRDYRNLVVPALFPQVRVVNLTVVGEPLMVPYLDEVLKDCAEYQVKLDINTNGMLLDEAMIRRVGPHTGGMIISFDGGVRRTFNRVRTGGDFNVITRNMALFDRWRRFELAPDAFFPGLYMACTLLRDNIEELPTMVEIAHLLRVDQLRGAWMIAFNDRLKPASCLNHRALTNKCLRLARRRAEELGVAVQLPAELEGVSEAEIDAVEVRLPELPDGPLPHLRELLAARDADEATWREALRRTTERRPRGASATPVAPVPVVAPGETFIPLTQVGGLTTLSDGLRQSPEERRVQAAGVGLPAAEPAPVEADDGRPRYTCKFLWNELFIGVSGDVTPCCTQGRPVVGNLHETPIEKIWNGPMMTEMRRRLLEGDPVDCCRDCNYNTQLGKGAYKEETWFPKLDRKL